MLYFIVPCSCSKLEDQEKYQRPEWLVGKLFTQIQADENLSVFASLLEYTGYDTILGVTGSYTVLAPDNQAFDAWFSARPEYDGDVTNIPYAEAEAMVQYHILQNRWSRKQFQSLDIYGWIDRDDPGNDKPRGYKRQTIFQNPNQKYWLKEIDEDIVYIVDSTESDDYKTVFSASRKYLPLFFSEYFDINNLKGSDYEFYFDRPFESSAIYMANAKSTIDEIPAENGFIYVIDQVIVPPVNAEEYLKMDHNGASTADFLELIYQIPKFSQDLIATFEQPEALAGGIFDTLYKLTYPTLTFNIQEELTGPNTNNPRYTVRYQNGLMVPTDQALDRLINDVITINSGYPHWPDWENVPKEIKKIIVNTHMAENPIYLTDIQEGFLNGSNDKITLDESVIRERYYGSNASILLIDEAITSRAFTSITGPIYLRPGYTTLLYALEYSKTLSALKKAGKEYIFLVPSDERMELDSSLILNWINIKRNKYGFLAFNRGSNGMQGVSSNQLAKRILNQVGSSLPQGIARREFIENLAGNFLVFDNENQTVTGGIDNAWGYLGDSAIHLEPVLFEEPTDNGLAYKFEGWFNMPVGTIYTVISNYSAFMELITKAELNDPQFYRFNFLNEGEFYTIFIPSEEALANSGADTLSIPDLQQFIKYHFIKGTRIWTDGSVPGGAFETLRKDESSNEFSVRYSLLNIETGYDYIDILDQYHNLYYRIKEDPEKTNKMIATQTVNINPTVHDYTITGVIHEIDTVLSKATENR